MQKQFTLDEIAKLLNSAEQIKIFHELLFEIRNDLCAIKIMLAQIGKINRV